MKHLKFTLTTLVLMLTLCLMGIQQCGGDDDGTPIPDGACRSDADCSNGESCLAPGEFAGCGACYWSESNCVTSADCGDGNVCATNNAPCQCNGPTQQCVAACTSTSCPDGQRCGSSGLCEYISCTEGTFTCPELTTCTPGASGDGCLRWSCAKDADCGSGNYCVENQCYSSLGTCTPPVP